MIPLVAVVPSRYERGRLDRLIHSIVGETDKVIVIDTGHEPPITSPSPKVEVIRLSPDRGIYHWWNTGWQAARAFAKGPVDVAILNDDVIVHRGTLRLLAIAMRDHQDVGAVYPDTRYKPARTPLPSARHMTIDRDPAGSRNLTGYCFVFRGELPIPAFDEGYHWWYGDSQFDETVRLAGFGVARVDGVPIAHVSDAERDGWARRPELKEIVERDGVRWADLHREIRDGRWYPIADMVKQ